MTEPEEIWNERKYWDWLQRIAMEAALQTGLRRGSDDAEECVSEFVAMKLIQAEDPVAEAETDEKRKAVRQAAATHAQRFRNSEQRRTRRIRIMPAHELSEQATEKTAPCPELLFLEAEFLSRLLGAAAGLSVRRQALWFRYALDEVKVVELQQEFGKNANALYKEIHVIKARIRKALSGNGLTEQEISEYRAALERLRNRL